MAPRSAIVLWGFGPGADIRVPGAAAGPVGPSPFGAEGQTRVARVCDVAGRYARSHQNHPRAGGLAIARHPCIDDGRGERAGIINHGSRM